MWAHRGHAASFEFCQVATTPEGELVGVVAGFPVRDGDRLSRRFIRLTLPRVPPWRLPKTFAHLYAAGGVAPQPPLDAYYVDALAVDHRHRRQGIAQRLLKIAEDEAARARLQRGSRSTPACTTARPARSTTRTASGSARSAAPPATASPRP